MRRLLIAIIGASLIAGPGMGQAQDADRPRDGGALCREYCAERAAERCDDIDSFRCGAYILGCLAGCNLKRL